MTKRTELPEYLIMAKRKGRKTDKIIIPTIPILIISK
jgi:hypothetical protein